MLVRILLLSMSLVVFSSVVSAVPPGDVMKFGNVEIDGKLHAERGMDCNSCHSGIFEMKKGAAKMTMDAIYKGKFCGTCHNGQMAFDSKAMSNCSKCHKM